MSRGFYKAIVVIVIGAVLVAGTIAWMRHLSPEDLTYVPKEAVITPAVQLLQRYVRIDTTNPPGNETAGAKFLIDYLARNGIHAELIESAPGRGNVYARIRGRRPGGGLLLLHHIDVVRAEGTGWTHPPFGGVVDLNMVYGRGTLDMKGIGICQLLAFVDLARSHQVPAHDVVYLAVADEEEGSRFGTQWLMEHRRDVLEGIAFALNEGGITETLKESVTWFGIEIGSKQIVRLRMTAPERKTLQQARLTLEPYFSPKDPERILPEVRAYFQAVAPRRIELPGLYENLDRTVASGKFWNLPPPYRALATTELTVSGVHSAESGGFFTDVTILVLPDVRPDDAVARFQQIVHGLPVAVEVTSTMGPTAVSSTATPFFSDIRKSVAKVYGGDVAVGPLMLPYATTDSRFLRSIGIQAYGLWPFPVDFFQSSGIHGMDERVRLDWFNKGVDLTIDLVRRYSQLG
ncbi:MAG: M20/M25/M40 family metallo-hydrolase [Acidobacteriota bacterium]